ncbi:MAG TPA: penicillin acylase family protein [Steroidobacteraceae bacterium]|nr:penicillin acylase family protein [Steroidobacteraceae bacterium]
MIRYTTLVPLGTMLALSLAQAGTQPPGQVKDPSLALPGLQGPARIVRDVDGMPHVYAHNEHDALYLQGWLQAQDRLFQIDVLRRQAGGTLAELVGVGALASDAELQTIGLARAAQRSYDALSPATRAGLQAYADGVNAWVARNPLPVQYGALEITKFRPWTAVDCAIIGKALAFNLSFDLDDGATRNYQAYVAKLGPQAAQALFFGDVFRSAPFDHAATIPDATGQPPFLGALHAAPAAKASAAPAATATAGRAVFAAPAQNAAARRALEDIRRRYEAVPFLRQTLQRTEQQIGSNEWAVSGALTRDGRPLVANDPHLGLDLPPTFYQIHLVGRTDGLDAIGSSVTGTPWVVLGQNRHVTWGETTTGFDVTDMYVDQLAPAPGTQSGLVSVHQDGTGAVTRIALSFKANLRDGLGNGADTVVTIPATPQNKLPADVLTLARRNHGPVVASVGGGKVVTVQYTGFGATRELDTFRLLNRARNVEEFTTALRFFDVGSQNFIYGDIDGNIGYFTSGEVPLREDLQANTVNGAPPWFVRDGFGGNEWLRDPSPDQFNGTGYLSLPFEELPRTVNPRNGWVVNANNDTSGATLDNDPLNQLRLGGQGIYYLGYTFDFGTRAGRITQALEARLAAGPVDRHDMKAIQADVTLLDAAVLTPYITGAFERGRSAGAPPELAAIAADTRVIEAAGRLAAWNFTTPTGAATGYDAVDVDGHLSPPSTQEIAHSIAATIYSVWRGQAIRNGVDRTLDALAVPQPGSGEAIKALRHLVERNGIGLSTVDFFAWTGLATPEQRRDYVMLKSLQDALDLLAGPAFAKAYAQSADQDDYRWGKLHRIVFDGLVVEGPFSIPNPQLGFPPSFPGLAGLATDGGFGVVDASAHSARADSADEFMFGSGPNRRYVGAPGTAPGTIDAETSLPGGMSGSPTSPFYANLLGRWLTNDTYPLRTGTGEVLQSIYSQQSFKAK